ncbi:hypothetical protein PILCRDRAFT_99463 [Piloderma croceum F 1598]|uniref:Aminoglycoside phosphotransferase domain-containing protein n=1 Tax=Piloderma croceum (strain F 1598) TaxID=765440 RepID=A0A0C3EFI1_PILCF|nr:hypothetical protein PILCRDRAFT_99463 [Piloderma croceum F 1598]
MASAPLSLHSHDSDCDWVDAQIDVTMRAVHWSTLSILACTLYGADSADWGKQLNGAYNLVCFLHLHDQQKTIVVARVPLQPADGWNSDRSTAISSQIISKVAMMEYIGAHTNIQIPHIIHYSTYFSDSGVRSPYILMSKVDGAPLSSVWNTMEDRQRDTVLRQVVEIILELSSQRFDRIRALFREDGMSKNAWHIKPMSFANADSSMIAHRVLSSKTYTSSTDYWIAVTNANIDIELNSNFGRGLKASGYAQAWFMRSLIPALYNPSLDAAGFPLSPGDFHSQNIMVTDVNSNPRITAYPLFIVNHPAWKDDNPLCAQNIRDQSAFNKFMQEAELKRDPEGCQMLSQAFTNCRGIYLFEQCLCYPLSYSVLYDQFFAHVFGDNAQEEFSVDYYWALMDNGLLKKRVQRLDTERDVRREALDTLGEGLVIRNLSWSTFKDLVMKYHDRFAQGGKVQEWLAVERQTQWVAIT